MKTFTLNKYDLHVSEEVERDTISLTKIIETIEKYGFKGHSKGGRNGIFLLNSSAGDRNLERTLDQFLDSSEGKVFLENYDLDITSLTPIKLVTHRRDDRRTIGYIDHRDIYLVKVGSY